MAEISLCSPARASRRSAACRSLLWQAMSAASAEARLFSFSRSAVSSAF